MPLCMCPALVQQSALLPIHIYNMYTLLSLTIARELYPAPFRSRNPLFVFRRCHRFSEQNGRRRTILLRRLAPSFFYTYRFIILLFFIRRRSAAYHHRARII